MALNEYQQAVIDAAAIGAQVIDAIPGSGKCITEGSLVLTDAGFVTIEKTYTADYKLLNGNFELVAPSLFWDMGVCNTIKVLTKSGYEIEGTPEHPIRALRNDEIVWVKLAELTLSDTVLLAFDTQQFGTFVNEWGTDGAYVMGQLVADGNIGRKRNVGGVVLHRRGELADPFIKWCTELGLNVRHYTHKTKRSESWMVNRKPLVQKLMAYGMSNGLAHDKVVPWCVLQGTREIQRAFLQGYLDLESSCADATGSGGPSMEVTTASELLSKQVQLMLLNFGVRATRRAKHIKGYGVYWRISISGNAARAFAQNVGYLHATEKAARLARIIDRPSNTNREVFPLTREYYAGIRNTMRSRGQWNTKDISMICGDGSALVMRHYFVSDRDISRGRLAIVAAESGDALATQLSTHYLCDGIASITPSSGHVYDYTIPDGHSFIANGFVNHNTATIEALIAQLINDGADPSRIIVVTFARKAANEMRWRIARAIFPGISERELAFFNDPKAESNDINGDTPLNRDWIEADARRQFLVDWVCTIHAASYRLLKAAGFKLKVLSGWQQHEADDIIKDGLAELHWKESPRSVKLWISRAILSLVEPKKSESWFTEKLAGFSDLDDDIPEKLAELYTRYITYNKQHDLVDFDQMTAKVIYLLRFNSEFRLRVGKMFDYVICDEGQDTDFNQFEILTALAKKSGNLVITGDVDQCQPTGTQVSLKGGGTRNIEDIEVGDEVVSYDRHAQVFVGRARVPKRVLEWGKRIYQGNMYTVTVGDRSTRCTANHRWLVRFNERATDLCVTYLMRKGDNFRVGWCQLFRSDSLLHVGARARLEKADAIWVLGMHRNRTDASVEESIIAAKYGLPTVTFRECNGSQHYTREAIDRIFAGIPNQRANAISCLAAYNRMLEYPFYQPFERKHRGRTTIFETHACNILPSIMSVLAYDDSRTGTWFPVELSVEQVSQEPVYSMNIETHGMYVADGILTHNSMYSFRGAKPTVLREHYEKTWSEVKRFNLPINYRSTRAIVGCASKLITCNYDESTQRFLKPAQPRPDAIDGVPLTYTETGSFDDLVSEMAAVIGGSNTDPGEWFILSRTRAECAAIHLGLLRNNIPAVNKVGGLLFSAPHIAKVIAYARLACDYEGSRNRAEIFKEIANVASADFRAPFSRHRHASSCKSKSWEKCTCPLVAEEGIDYSHARYYGQKAIESAEQIACAQHCTIYEAIEQQQYDKNRGGYPTSNSKGARDLIGFIQRASALINDGHAAIAFIIDQCVLPWVKAEDGLTDADIADSKGEDFDMLRSTAQGKTLVEFLRDVDGLGAADPKAGDIHCVKIGTVHWAKGAESNHVIANTTRLPISPPGRKLGTLPTTKPPTINEERNLLFVAITRARETCHVMGALEWNNHSMDRSQFIAELDIETRIIMATANDLEPVEVGDEA